jgi:hypothetical protein
MMPGLLQIAAAATKGGLLVLAFTLPYSVRAHSLEDAYLASRDHYIAELKKLDANDATKEQALQEEKRALLDLKRQLMEVIGHALLNGASAAEEVNLETLFEGDPGFGQLDGLTYSMGKDTQLIMTTQTLLMRWLRASRGARQERVSHSTTLRDALKSDGFYLRAISPDTAVLKYADLPVIKPAGAQLAVALADARTQDATPRLPDEIIVSVLRDVRLFIVTAPIEAKISAIEACDRISKAYRMRQARISNAYSRAKGYDAALAEKSISNEDKADLAYRRCFSERLRSQPFFRRLIAQAQNLVNLIARIK